MASAACCSAASATDPFAKLDALPSDVQLAAVFDAPGAGWLREGTGLVATGLAGQTGLFARTRTSWANLAQTLGMTIEQADASLLGGTVVVGWRAPKDDGLLGALGSADTGWILISEVDQPTAALARERLRAVPRRIAFGTAVYSIDGGRIGMALIEGERSRQLLIAPVENAELIDECLGRLRRGVGDPGPGRETRELLGPVDPGWSGIAAVRIGDDQALPVALVIRAGEREVGVRFAARGTAEAGAPLGLLDRIGGDALLAMVSGGNPLGGEDGSIRLGFSLRAAPSNPKDSPQRSLSTEDGYALIMRESGDGSMTAAIAARARSDAAFARTVDETLARVVDPSSPPDFGGRFPEAVRTHTGKQNDGTRWPGDRAQIAWCMHADAADRSGMIALAFGDAGSDAAREARHTREAWTEGDDLFDPTIVSAGYAMPARLVKAAGMESNPVGLIGRAVERADWTVRQQGEIVRGEIRLRFLEPGARLGAE
ncbi:MAG: hypothetical protein D6692_05550 [Planctomycetota bacterium]|nr:MAG: hypothetical protein D6692_05550 [Planctomycetota bacterium]